MEEDGKMKMAGAGWLAGRVGRGNDRKNKARESERPRAISD